MSWHVYLLRCSDGSYYCGITKNIARRLLEHNGEKRGGARYTASRRPVELLAACDRATLGEALKLEALIKKMPKNKKLQTLNRHAHAIS